MTIASPYLDTQPTEPVHDAVVPILVAVATEFGVSIEQIMGLRRTKSIAEARKLCYWLLRTRTRMSFPEIGRVMNHRDHSTIIAGFERAVILIRTEPSYAAASERVKARLESERAT